MKGGEGGIIRCRYVGMWWFLGGRFDIGEVIVLVDQVEK